MREVTYLDIYDLVDNQHAKEHPNEHPGIRGLKAMERLRDVRNCTALSADNGDRATLRDEVFKLLMALVEADVALGLDLQGMLQHDVDEFRSGED